MPKQRISRSDKLWVAARANHRCEYCQCLKSYVPGPFDIDHIDPESKGGSSNLENLAYSCDGCNGHKYQKTEAIDPETGLSAKLFHPRNDKWKEHFQWSSDFLIIEGISSTGRATIKTLQLNRPELVNYRTALSAIKKHPPKDTL